MAIEKMKEQMTAELVSVRTELDRARVEMVAATARTAELERQELALQSALDILDGKNSSVTFQPSVVGSGIPGDMYTKNVSPIPQNGPRNEVVDGVEYEIPEGFEIGRNSFGEISIVPVGTVMPAMAEPTKPAPVADLLPLLDTQAGFDKPEDLL
jgi:hypothetical protein